MDTLFPERVPTYLLVADYSASASFPLHLLALCSLASVLSVLAHVPSVLVPVLSVLASVLSVLALALPALYPVLSVQAHVLVILATSLFSRSLALPSCLS